MKRLLLLSLALLLAIMACNQTPATPTPIIPTPVSPVEKTPMSPPTEKPASTETPPVSVALHRGVNFGNMLEAPNEGEWGLTVQEEYFDLVKDAGFDFVRLPVEWNAHSDRNAPYVVDPFFFARIDEVVGWALKRDLTIIVDFHYYENLMSNPWGNEERYIAIWKQIAEHYKDYPPTVLFELMNEPYDQLNAALWNEYSSKALATVRESNPTRDVVIGPTQWNSFDWISTLDVQDDPHVIYTFHYYEPFHFTHQGAEWIGDESNAWLGTTWDATGDQKAEVISNFDSVSDWAQRHGNVRILLGEFGAYSRGPQDSRVRWTTFIREQAEAHGFAWSYWELAAGFGIYDPDAKVWRDDLLKALIP